MSDLHELERRDLVMSIVMATVFISVGVALYAAAAGWWS